ncbi:MAG: tetraacyldisaccharide 4'-kinase [Alphaproteobacteria bacterium]|nr:tetraacyldisaccharide 4'-kinase [Alphaproteobacteria bacterium]
MKLRTPSFWYGESGPDRIAARALAPAAKAYQFGRRLHAYGARTARAPLPVVCIGNLVAGGSGKTPAAILVAGLLRDAGVSRTPFFLSRGYGGFLKEALIRDDRQDWSVRDVGDEPLLLAPHAPVVIDANRFRGAQKAARNGADLVVMDDGMQNPGIIKDAMIVIIDGATGFGNKRLIPAGPLREPLKEGLQRGDAFVIVGEDATNVKSLLPPGKPVFEARLLPPSGYELDSRADYVAFTGIARPSKFRHTLEELGATLVGWHEFPDHHLFSSGELAGLIREADSLNAQLITTEKDHVRLRTLPGASRVEMLPVEMRLDNADKLVDVIARLLQGTR